MFTPTIVRPNHLRRTKMAKAKINIYDVATNALCGMLEEAGKDWKQPWKYTRHQNVSSGKPYRGVNIHLLNYHAHLASADPQETRAIGQSGIWGTFKQWNELDCKVKGQGAIITFFSMFEKEEKDENGKPTKVKIPIWRTYKIFAAEQVEGYTIPEADIGNPDEKIEIAELYFLGTNAILTRDDHAYYVPTLDYIGMPPFETFDSSDSYYSVLYHELAHWTGHKDRLDRNGIAKTIGNRYTNEYAYEELVGELGGLFNCINLGITSTPQESNAQYINSWLSALKDNKRLVFTASKDAQRIVDYTNKLNEEYQSDSELTLLSEAS